MSSSFRDPATIGAIASVALVGAGAVEWITGPSGTASFGWYSYAPIEMAASFAQFALFGQHLLPAALVTVGLIIGGVALGFHWGRCRQKGQNSRQ